MFCYNCGKELPENAVFCPFCGTQVSVSVHTETGDVQDDGSVRERSPEVENIEEREAISEPSPGEIPVVDENEPFYGFTAQEKSETEAEYKSLETEYESKEEPEGEDIEPEREVAPYTISSFIWSIVAYKLAVVPALGLAFSLIAFIKSLKGRRITKAAPERYKLKGFLTAALIISIIALVGSVLGPILFATYFSLFKDLFNGSGPFSSTFV